MMPDTFYVAICEEIKLPQSAWCRFWFNEWARWEGTGARFNPLATTQPGGEDPLDPWWNTFGDRGQYHVRNYASEREGAIATARTLTNGYYPTILASLRDRTIYPGTTDELRKWGTTGFADAIDAGWAPPAGLTDPPEEPPAPEPGGPAPLPAPVEQTIALLLARIAELNRYIDRLNFGTLARFRAVNRAFDHLVEGMTLALAEVDIDSDAAADPDTIPEE